MIQIMFFFSSVDGFVDMTLQYRRGYRNFSKGGGGGVEEENFERKCLLRVHIKTTNMQLFLSSSY